MMRYRELKEAKPLSPIEQLALHDVENLLILMQSQPLPALSDLKQNPIPNRADALVSSFCESESIFLAGYAGKPYNQCQKLMHNVRT